MTEIYIDKNGATSTILENFDSLDKRIFLVWGVYQTFLKEPLINLHFIVCGH